MPTSICALTNLTTSDLNRIAPASAVGKEMAGGSKKRLAAAKPAAKGVAKAASKAGKAHRTAKGAAKASNGTKAERRAHKLEQRKKEKKAITPAQWNEPAPSHLVAKLDVPRISSKYQSYFEFAENSEKKEKKLEFKVCYDVFVCSRKSRC